MCRMAEDLYRVLFIRDVRICAHVENVLSTELQGGTDINFRAALCQMGKRIEPQRDSLRYSEESGWQTESKYLCE